MKTHVARVVLSLVLCVLCVLCIGVGSALAQEASTSGTPERFVEVAGWSDFSQFILSKLKDGHELLRIPTRTGKAILFVDPSEVVVLKDGKVDTYVCTAMDGAEPRIRFDKDIKEKMTYGSHLLGRRMSFVVGEEAIAERRLTIVAIGELNVEMKYDAEHKTYTFLKK